MQKRRVVVTGIGMISPLGIGNEPTWRGLLEGKSGVDTITKFDATDYACKIAGEVRGFDPEQWIEKKEVKKSDTFIHYAVAAAQMAVDDAGLDTGAGDNERLGVIIGSASGGLPLIEETHKKLLDRGPGRISPFFIPGLIVNLASGHISIRFNCKGPSSAPATACATGARAIRATTIRGTPRARGTSTATASSWARAPASCCSRSASAPSPAARRSTA